MNKTLYFLIFQDKRFKDETIQICVYNYEITYHIEDNTYWISVYEEFDMCNWISSEIGLETWNLTHVMEYYPNLLEAF